MSVVSQPAPSFSIPAVSIHSLVPADVSLSDFAGQWLLLLFYPRDFSFVCPTELTSFSARMPDFEQRHCRILGISVDTIQSHIDWLSTPPAEGGIGPLQFPLASDSDGEVARSFGIWLPDSGLSARGLFLIDPEGILQYGVVHNLSVGRNVDEILRVLDATQSGELCPASWTAADGHIDPEKVLQPGRVLGHYKIRHRLGSGTFGSVFAAWDLRLERNVALKVLKRKAVESREASLREARAAAPLNHPNICTMYAVEEIDGLSVIAMEFINGRPLGAVISDDLSLGARVKLAHGIALGLAAAHGMGVVHGDLKPGNVLVDDHLVPRILDFGLSRRSDRQRDAEEAALTVSDSSDFESRAGDMDATVDSGIAPMGASRTSRAITGTPAYMSPQQWHGSAATPASDLFAFGLMFFELLTGRRALTEEEPARLFARVRDPELPDFLGAQLPEKLRPILCGALTSESNSKLSAVDVVELLRKHVV